MDLSIHVCSHENRISIGKCRVMQLNCNSHPPTPPPHCCTLQYSSTQQHYHFLSLSFISFSLFIPSFSHELLPPFLSHPPPHLPTFLYSFSSIPHSLLSLFKSAPLSVFLTQPCTFTFKLFYTSLLSFLSFILFSPCSCSF